MRCSSSGHLIRSSVPRETFGQPCPLGHLTDHRDPFSHPPHLQSCPLTEQCPRAHTHACPHLAGSLPLAAQPAGSVVSHARVREAMRIARNVLRAVSSRRRGRMHTDAATKRSTGKTASHNSSRVPACPCYRPVVRFPSIPKIPQHSGYGSPDPCPPSICIL